MARYRLFEKNPITNEWIDRDWAEGKSQQEALRGIANAGGTYFVVPETSYHPVTMAKVEVVRWEYQDAPIGAEAEV